MEKIKTGATSSKGICFLSVGMWSRLKLFILKRIFKENYTYILFHYINGNIVNQLSLIDVARLLQENRD